MVPLISRGGLRGGAYRTLVKVFFFLLALTAWDALGDLSSQPKLFPSVRDIFIIALLDFARSVDHATTPTLAVGLHYLFWNIGLTTLRIFLAIVVAIPVGLVLGAVVLRALPTQLLPTAALSALNGIPSLALIPLFVLWFGDTELFSIFGYLIFSLSILIATVSFHAVESIPVHVRMAMQKVSISRWSNLIHYTLPAVWYRIRTELKQIIAFSWAFSVGAETIVNKNGLGYILYQAYFSNKTSQLILIAVCYSILGWLSVQVAGVVASFNMPTSEAKAT